jgi:hypothetical protein
MLYFAVLYILVPWTRPSAINKEVSGKITDSYILIYRFHISGPLTYVVIISGWHGTYRITPLSTITGSNKKKQGLIIFDPRHW